VRVIRADKRQPNLSALIAHLDIESLSSREMRNPPHELAVSFTAQELGQLGHHDRLRYRAMRKQTSLEDVGGPCGRHHEQHGEGLGQTHAGLENGDLVDEPSEVH
jgi:hypothetical protein